MFVRAVCPVIDMHKMLEVTKLELDGSPNSMSLRHLGAAIDDRRAMGHAALVIVREIEDEEVVEVEFLGSGHGSIHLSLLPRSSFCDERLGAPAA